jgi:hypothetical protein
MTLMAAMRRGDRDALAQLLELHGGALEALMGALDPEGQLGGLDDPPDGGALASATVVAWRSCLTALPGVDARGHLLATLTGALVEAQSGDKGPERGAFARALAAQHLGVGKGGEAAQVVAALAADVELVALRGRILSALEQAVAVPVGAPNGFAACWAQVRPRLD